jgi:hypothetical protein
VVLVAAQRREEVGHDCGLLDIGLRGVRKPSLKPPDGHPSSSRSVAKGDERREGECVVEGDVMHLAQRKLGRDDVAAFYRSLKSRRCVSVLAQPCLPGPDGGPSLRVEEPARDQWPVAEKCM